MDRRGPHTVMSKRFHEGRFGIGRCTRRRFIGSPIFAASIWRSLRACQRRFSVVADFPLDGLAAGENLAKKFKPLPDSRWELKLARPIMDLPRGKLTVAVKDRQGNTSRMERTFSVGKK